MKLNAITCMAPPFDINPLTKMWCLMTTSWVFVCNLLDYVKLVELVMVQATWKMKGVSLCWFLWSLNSTIGSLLICHLLCTCSHNNSTLCQTSHMPNVFNSGEEHNTNITWWLGNTRCVILRPIFAKAKIC
jgi:hypothetical protein